MPVSRDVDGLGWRESSGGFYTAPEVAEILGVPQRRVPERLATEEIEGERDPITGRWKVPEGALDRFGLARPSAAEATWLEEKECLLAELRKERARADRERERADRERNRAERERELARGLREELEAERSRRRPDKGSSWMGMFGGRNPSREGDG